jgi:hypothetical protein
MLKRIKVNEVEKGKLIYVEISSGAKHKVGGKVMNCSIILGYFVTKGNIYVTILGYYDIVIGMDWLESHDVILKCKMKWLSLIDDLGKSRVIVGRNQGVSLRFISSLQLHKSMFKECKIYAILVLNERGEAEALENLIVVQEFEYVFPEDLPGLTP